MSRENRLSEEKTQSLAQEIETALMDVNINPALRHSVMSKVKKLEEAVVYYKAKNREGILNAARQVNACWVRDGSPQDTEMDELLFKMNMELESKG